LDKSVGPAPNYGLDWFEGALVRPDLVLADFRSIVSGNSTVNGAPAARRWLRNIAKGEPVSILLAAQCSSPTQCQTDVPLTPICPFVKGCATGAAAQLQVGLAPPKTKGCCLCCRCRCCC
jgi:hypothetical protein